MKKLPFHPKIPAPSLIVLSLILLMPRLFLIKHTIPYTWLHVFIVGARGTRKKVIAKGEEKKGHGKVSGFKIAGDGRRTSYCKFLHTEVTAIAKTGSGLFSPLITKVVRSLFFSAFFSRSSRSNCIFADWQRHRRWPVLSVSGTKFN